VKAEMAKNTRDDGVMAGTADGEIWPPASALSTAVFQWRPSSSSDFTGTSGALALLSPVLELFRTCAAAACAILLPPLDGRCTLLPATSALPRIARAH